MTRVAPDGSPKMHKGVDLLCIEKWPVFAAHDGKVARAGWENEDNLKQGYGMRVWIVSLGGEMKTVYAHLSMILVPLGAIVQAGDLIGLTGRTGNITADVPTHLHFEVHVPDAVDPAPMLVT
jgi:murein DD-endopeptidase MepM/ murein hydrolase activator NlpD